MNHKKIESSLIKIAEQDPNDTRANKAMRILNGYFDKSYHWCPELDFAVIKTSECFTFSNCHKDYLQSLTDY